MKRITFRASLLMMALMIALPAWAGIFKDDFNDGNFDGWEIENCRVPGSEWKVDNGVLTCRRPSHASTFLLFGEKEWKNYSIEFDAKMVQILSDFHAIGMDLRLQNTANGIWCAIRGGVNNAFIQLWLNDQPANQISKPFDFELNRWYRLKGIANDDNFEFYIDGELMISLSDSHFPTGYVDLDANGCLAHFDNVVITGDDVPDNSSAVSFSGKLAATWGQLRSQ
jgi:hypothetical protein